MKAMFEAGRSSVKSRGDGRFLPVILCAVLYLGSSGAALAQTPKTPGQELMRQKLEHAQRVLEGIATEDFALIIAHGQKLVALTQEASWQASDNPEYVLHSDNFRRSVTDLVNAAKNKNVDAATLAYVRMAMNCVECHKFVSIKIRHQAPAVDGR
jgi:hypothetical protein